MEYGEKCQLTLYMIDKVDYYWNRLYVSTSVVVGFVLGNEIFKLHPMIPFLLLFIYLVYLGGNLSDHLRAYKFLILLLKEIKDSPEEFKDNTVMTKLSKLSYKIETYTCIGAYLLALGVVCFIAFIERILC